MAHYDCDFCGASPSQMHSDNCPDNPANQSPLVNKIVIKEGCWLEACDKPPIGLRPQSIVRVLRLQEIQEAFDRYLKAGKQIPQEWVDEFSVLNSEM